MIDRYEKLDHLERWNYDVLSMADPAGFFMLEDVDMTATQETIGRLRQQGIKGTFTPFIVRAVALALSRHPEFNRLILSKKLVHPSTIDIGLSVSTELSLMSAAVPTFVLQDAGQKNLMTIAQEIGDQAAKIRKEDHERVAKLRKFAQFVPFSWMRRTLLRMMKSKMSVVRERIGTFHITSVPSLQSAVPLTYPSSAVLSFGRVEDRVVAREGRPVVRPMTTLGIAGDHRLWNANSVAVLLKEIKHILETGELASEINWAEASVAAR